MGKPTEHDEGLWTVKDVADAYRIHTKTVGDMVKAKKIPPPLEGWEGGERRWLKSECVAHMRAMRKREATEEAA